MKRAIVATIASSLVLAFALPTSAANDRVAPKLRFTTEEGDVLVSGASGTEAGSVAGVARDGGSGIKKVLVTYCPGDKSNGGWTCKTDITTPGTIVTERATLACTNKRRRCTWMANVPTAPGNYLVFAKAVDRSARRASIGPIEIVVI